MPKNSGSTNDHKLRSWNIISQVGTLLGLSALSLFFSLKICAVLSALSGIVFLIYALKVFRDVYCFPRTYSPPSQPQNLPSLALPPLVQPTKNHLEVLNRLSSSYLFYAFPLFLAFGVAVVFHLKQAAPVREKDEAQIVALIEKEPTLVGASESEIGRVFSNNACYVAQGRYFGKEAKVYGQDVANVLAFKRYDHKAGKQAIIHRYRGDVPEENNPMNGNGIVYKQRFDPYEDQLSIDLENNVSYATSRTLSRDAKKKGDFFKPAPLDEGNDRVAWVFVRANENADWVIWDVHGGLTKNNILVEYDALTRSVEARTHSSPRNLKSKGCNELLAEPAPKRPTAAQLKEFKSWIEEQKDHERKLLTRTIAPK